MIGSLWMVKWKEYVKETDRRPFEGTIPAYARSNWEKPRKIPVSIANPFTEIWIWDLTNMKQHTSTMARNRKNLILGGVSRILILEE